MNSEKDFQLSHSLFSYSPLVEGKIETYWISCLHCRLAFCIVQKKGVKTGDLEFLTGFYSNLPMHKASLSVARSFIFNFSAFNPIRCRLFFRSPTKALAIIKEHKRTSWQMCRRRCAESDKSSKRNIIYGRSRFSFPPFFGHTKLIRCCSKFPAHKNVPAVEGFDLIYLGIDLFKSFLLVRNRSFLQHNISINSCLFPILLDSDLYPSRAIETKNCYVPPFVHFYVDWASAEFTLRTKKCDNCSRGKREEFLEREFLERKRNFLRFYSLNYFLIL